MDQFSPIAVFDSGLGGLSVWKEIVALLPHESVIYYGDGKNCPYGHKSEEELRRITRDIAAFLIGQGAKMIVVACNTATAVAIETLRGAFPEMTFVGMEPAVKPAALASKTGVIGVLATENSLKGNHLRRAGEAFGDKVRIITAEGHGFVDLVERDMEHSEMARRQVEEVIGPLVEAGVDHIVLGCTHYPFLTGAMERITVPKGIAIVDPAPAVARQVRRLLAEKNLLAPESNVPQYRFHTSADEEYRLKMKEKATRLIGPGAVREYTR